MAWMATGLAFVPFGSLPLVGIDHTFILTQAREILNHSSDFYNHDLGFPVGADKRYFPTTDYLGVFLLWIGAVLSGNVFDTVQIYYLLSVSALFSFCFLVLAGLGLRKDYAFLAGLAYCMLPFAATRYWIHDYYAPYYVAPFGAALAIRIGRIPHHETLKASLRTQVLGVIPLSMMVLIALRVFYFGFFSCLLISMAGLLVSARNRRWGPLCVAAVQSGVITSLLMMSMGPFLLSGHPMPHRAAADQPEAGVRLPDALGQLPSFARPSSYGFYTSVERDPTEGSDFWPGPALSLIILCSPLLLMIAAMKENRQAEAEDGRTRRDIVLCLSLITAIMLFAVSNGYGYIFNMLAGGAIRSQNRIGVFAGFLALYILSACAERSGRRWPRFSMALLVCALAVNALPQAGYALRAFNRSERDQALRATSASVTGSLAALHAVGAHAVLQLPVMGWPEQQWVNTVDPYDDLWFYILDAPRSPIKWSYGLDVHQPFYRTLAAWNASLQESPSGTTWLPFQCSGYDAVVIDKTAEDGPVADAPAMGPGRRSQKLRESLERLDAKTLFENDRYIVMTLPTPDFGSPRCDDVIRSIPAVP